MAESDEVVDEGDHAAVVIQSALEEMKFRQAVEVVPHVIPVIPQQLYRGAHLFEYPGRVSREVVTQAPAEPPPIRVMPTVMSVTGVPRVVATSFAPAQGFFVGARRTTLPS